MGVDESFAEYAAARWSMLYRLATLLVGADDAERLTRAALVRVYLHWDDVRMAGSSDTAAKRILAHTAVKRLRIPDLVEDSAPPARPGRERLWAEISALSPQLRA